MKKETVEEYLKRGGKITRCRYRGDTFLKKPKGEYTLREYADKSK